MPLFSDQWIDLLSMRSFCFHLCDRQAKESGFVFGAYTHCSWRLHTLQSDSDEDEDENACSSSASESEDTEEKREEVNKEKDLKTLTDPSGQSFLFSLVSAAGKAARFSLRKKDEAVMLHSNGGVHFGWRASFALFSQGDAAGDIRGNQACVLDARSSYQPDDKDIKGDETFFA